MGVPRTRLREHLPGLTVVGAVLLMTAGSTAASAGDPFAAMNVQPAVREVQAPTFHLRTPDGKPLALEELRGKVVAFYYWRTW